MDSNIASDRAPGGREGSRSIGAAPLETGFWKQYLLDVANGFDEMNIVVLIPIVSMGFKRGEFEDRPSWI